MRTPLYITVVAFLCIIAFVVPFDTTSAQGLVSCSGVECEFCHLTQLVQNILNFIVKISISIGALMFAVAGIMWMANTGSPERLSTAKKIFISVFWGLIVVLGSWLIVDTILKVLTNNSGGLAQPWVSITCQGRPSRPGTTIPEGWCRTNSNGNDACFISQSACNADASGDPGSSGCKNITQVRTTSNQITANVGPDTRTPAQKAADEADMRERLAANNVAVNRPNHCPVNTSYKAVGGCTDVSRLTPSTFEYVTSLARRCNCRVTITGGSEAGHKTHGDGNRLDLALSPVSRWTSRTLVKVGVHPRNKSWTLHRDTATNVCWLREGDHWHVNTTGKCD